MKLLEVHTDDELNFNEHVNKICKSAGNQLNALTQLKSFLGLKEKKGFSQLSHKNLLDRIESLHKQALRFWQKDYVKK